MIGKTFRFLLCFYCLFILIALLSFVSAVNEESPKAEEKSDPDVARFEGKILKMSELVEGAGIRSGYRMKRMTADQLYEMESDKLKDFVENYFFNEKLAQLAEKEGMTQDPKIKHQIDFTKKRIIANMIYQTQVVDQAPLPSEEEVKKYYEDNKNIEFKRPFSFKMRHIFLSTYTPYVSVEGDSLESIAEKMSGNKKMMEFILRDDDTKEPRYVKPEDRDEKPYLPLKPGERLLVPKPEKEKQKIREKINKIAQDLKKGADFENMAQKFSEGTPTQGKIIGPVVPEKDKKPMLPEIVDAVKNTPVGKTTDIVQTKHGFNIIKVEEKTEEGFFPFEHAKRSIMGKMANERRRKKTRSLLLDIPKNTKSITFNKDVFSKKDAAPESVIVSIADDVKFTLRDFKEAIPEKMRKSAKTPQEKLLLSLESRNVILPLLYQYGVSQKLEQADDFKKEFKHRKIMILADKYNRKMLSELPKPNDEILLKFYNENKDRYTELKQYDVGVIGLKVLEPGEKMDDEKKEEKIESLKEKLNEIRQKIIAGADFEKMAQEYSEDPSVRTKGSLGKVPANFRKGFGGKLDKMKAGDMSEPFVYANYVYILKVHDIEEEKLRPFEEAKRAVEKDWDSENRNSAREEKKEEILKAGKFEFLMKKEIE